MTEILQGVAFRQGLAHYSVKAAHIFVSFAKFDRGFIWEHATYIDQEIKLYPHHVIGVDLTIAQMDLMPYIDQFTDEHKAEIVAAVLRGEIK